MLYENLARSPQSSSDDFPEVMQRGVRHHGPRLQFGHVEQVRDEAVEPLGLVNNVSQQVGFLGFGELSCKIPEGAGRSQNRSKWRLEVVRNRGQQGRAQTI